jgi:hypothetical protein
MTKYQLLKNNVYHELMLWIQSLTTTEQPNMNLNVIQPDAIITFMHYYIKKHGKKTPTGSSAAGSSAAGSSSSESSTLQNYYIAAPLLKNVIGGISSILSTIYGRIEIWSPVNHSGNPCKANSVILFKNTYIKQFSKNKIATPVTPITKSMLIEIIDALDNYIDEHLQNPEKLNILKLLLLHRDIAYYIYLFISSQRGGEGCKLMIANVCFNRNPDDDTIESANVTIPAADVKNDQKNNILINRHDVFHKGDKYCFLHRYPIFKALCIKHGYMETDMKVIFPSSKRTKTLNFAVHMKYASCISKFKDNLKLVGLLDKYSYLTLHSFRRDSLQNNGESQKDDEAVANEDGFDEEDMDDDA